MSSMEFGRTLKSSKAKDDSSVTMPATSTVRRVNYYFAKPKDQTPTRPATTAEDFQQQQLKCLTISSSSSSSTNKNSNKTQTHEHVEIEAAAEQHQQQHQQHQLAAKSLRADATKAEGLRTKKFLQTYEKDTISINANSSCSVQCANDIGLKIINTLPKGIFSKKTKATDIITEYDAKSPMFSSNNSDPLWCSEPIAWQNRHPFPLEKTATKLNLSILSADFLQHFPNHCLEKRNFEANQNVDEIEQKSDLQEMLTTDFTDYEVFNMHTLPDLPGSEKLL